MTLPTQRHTAILTLQNTFSEIFAKPINYVSPQPEEFAETLTKVGVPARVVGITVGFALAQAQGELDIVSNDLENLLGRKPVSLKDFLKHFYKQNWQKN